MGETSGWKRKVNLLIDDMYINILFSISFIFFQQSSYCQLTWQNVDTLYRPLPPSVHVYFTNDKTDTAAFRAYYVIADIKDKNLDFTTDTTYKRRLTPSQFYEKNNHPLVVVNGTFFSFETNQNLNVVIKDGKLVSYTAPIKGRGKDSLNYSYAFKGAIGITKKSNADVAWVYTDSNYKYASALHYPTLPVKSKYLVKDSIRLSTRYYNIDFSDKQMPVIFSKKWKMKTAIGGGPVLLHNSKIIITNDEERMFAGKAIDDKHPRTAMGYTKDSKLIILVIEGRNPNASGATLTQAAQILKDLGCIEALNLDGGGSSCMLVNGKETIKISDKSQRPIPAVFLIKTK